MKHVDDKKTPDLLGDSCDLAGPVPLKPSKAERAAARALRFRERHGVQALTVNIDAEVLAAFDAYCIAKDRKKSAVIAKLIESQLLRKR